MHNKRNTIAFAFLLVGLECPVACGQPQAAGSAEACETVRREAARLTRELSAQSLTYTVTEGSSTRRVGVSPDYTLCEADRFVFAVSSDGGFFLSRPSRLGPPVISSVLPRSEAAAGPKARLEYASKNGFASSPHVVTGDPAQSEHYQADFFFNLGPQPVVSCRPTADGNLRLDFTSPMGRPGGPTAGTVRGYATIDPRRRHVVIEHAITHDLGPVGAETVTVRRQYYDPGQFGLPVPLVKSWEQTRSRPNKKPEVRSLQFSDYRSEVVPAEHLALSHYQLPDEIVNDGPAIDRRLLAAGVVVGVAAAAYGAWRWRRRRS
jgi:hypothetical protein